MSDLHSINEAINKKAGRKLLPSIGVGLSLISLVWFALSYQRVIFAIVVAIAVVLGVRELVRAFSARGVVISFNGLTLAAIGLSYAAWVGGVAGLAIATAIAFPLLLIRALLQGPDGFVAKATATTFGLLYLPFLAGFLILLARPSTGFQRVMTFMVLVGCNDTFGYLVGVLIGKHPMAPKISPKKSWEGFVGALVLQLIVGVVLWIYVFDQPWWEGAIVGFVMMLTATIGDLVESMIKRDLGIKDMGSLLPGHGGVMDRLDSLVINAFMAWLLFGFFL